MKRMAIWTLAALVLTGCGTKGDSGTTPAGAPTGTVATGTPTTATGTPTTSTPTTGTTNTTTPSGDYIQASGSFNGTPFSVSCDLDDPVTSSLTSGQYRGHEQCPGTSFQIQCRADGTFPNVSGELMVNVRIWDSETNYTIVLGDTMGWALDSNTAPNAGAHSLTLERFTVDSSGKGSFSAEWTDAGGDYGQVSGTFDATCDG